MPKVIVGNEEREFDVVIYVDITGDDATGDGSRKKPFRHIDKAYSALPNTGKACIYTLSGGDYNLVSGISGVLKSTIEITYTTHPLHIGKAFFLLQKLSHNPNIEMNYLNQFHNRFSFKIKRTLLIVKQPNTP